MFIKRKDGSIEDSNGKVICFSIERFKKDICEGNCCFICGVSTSQAKFNKEHILPNWLLRRYKLHDRTIILPNRTKFAYGKYVVPCCQSCNSLMGEKIERPVQELLTQGYEAVTNHLNTHGPWLFFVWFSNIYIKTHLKDKNFRIDRDLREEDYKISDLYEWEELHHVHCLSRIFYTSCSINPKILGSFLVFKAEVNNFEEKFDYMDLYYEKTLLLRVEDICFIVVLNDSGISQIVLEETLKKISGALSTIQLREIFARIAHINFCIEKRPIYHSEYKDKPEHLEISAILPGKIILTEQGKLGDILYDCTKDYFAQMTNPNIEFIKDHVRQGKYTFLFDSEGDFITNSMELL